MSGKANSRARRSSRSPARRRLRSQSATPRSSASGSGSGRGGSAEEDDGAPTAEERERCAMRQGTLPPLATARATRPRDVRARLRPRAHLLLGPRSPLGGRDRGAEHARGMRRMRAALEAQLVEEETSARVAAAVEARVAEVMASEAVQATLGARLQAERRVLEEQARRRPPPLPAGRRLWSARAALAARLQARCACWRPFRRV